MTTSDEPPRVGIAATAVCTPAARSVPALVDRLKRGPSTVVALSDCDVPAGAPTKGARFSPPIHVDVDDPEKRILGFHGTLLMELAAELAPHVEARDLAPERVGLYAALGMIDASPQDLEAAAKTLKSNANGDPTFDDFFDGGYRTIHPLWPLSMLNNVALGQVSIAFNIRGDNAVFASGWDSGVRALHEATRAIRMHRIDAAYVLGAAPPIDERSLTRLALLPRGAPNPGEGAAGCLLVNKSLASVAHLTGSATAFADPRVTPETGRAVGEALRRRAVGITTPLKSSSPGLVMTSQNALNNAVLQAWRDYESDAALDDLCGNLGPAGALLSLAVAVERLSKAEAIDSAVDHVWIVGDDVHGGVGAVRVEAS